MITATKVPDRRRLAALPEIFGTRCVQLESAVFGMASELIEGYSGAYWEFFYLDNGGFYMAPRVADSVNVHVDGNGFSGEMSDDATGIVCCLMTYSNESFNAQGSYQEALAEQFHLLRDYAAEHPEARAIFAAID